MKEALNWLNNHVTDIYMVMMFFAACFELTAMTISFAALYLAEVIEDGFCNNTTDIKIVNGEALDENMNDYRKE